MMENKAYLLTPGGTAAIAVVRLVGPLVAAFLKAHFSRPVAEGRCVHGELRDGQRVLDDALAALGPRGAWVDLNLHGGPWVVKSVMDLAARAGFELRPVCAGPLDLDAVDGDTLLEREVMAFLPLARTELALRALLAQPSAWARLQADPPDQGVTRRMLNDRALIHLLCPPCVALVGIPNAGKSTLANRLFAQERSITADRPGTTRDWVGEIANLDGLAVMLVDTPGIRSTDDPIEREAIRHGAEIVNGADLVVLVLDAGVPLQGDQEAMLRSHRNALIVINKADCAGAWNWPDESAVRTVATTGQGIDELCRRIRQHFGCEAMDPAQARIWTDRQRCELERIASAAR